MATTDRTDTARAVTIVILAVMALVLIVSGAVLVLAGDPRSGAMLFAFGALVVVLVVKP